MYTERNYISGYSAMVDLKISVEVFAFVLFSPCSLTEFMQNDPGKFYERKLS